MEASGLIVASARAGEGKTTIARGLVDALRARGAIARGFRVGPDSGEETSEPTVGLDSWAMRLSTLAGAFDDLARGAEFVIGDGWRGVFDGVDPEATSGSPGSTADLAALLGLPTILVVDARGLGATAAASIEGIDRHTPSLAVAGIVFCRVADEAHERLLREACELRFSIPTIGALREASPAPSAEEHACEIEGRFDLDRLSRLARVANLAGLGGEPRPLPPIGRTIAIARGGGFSVDATIAAGWRRLGAELSWFAPMEGEAPDGRADAIVLAAWRPLDFARLAASGSLARIAAAARRGTRLYAEGSAYAMLGGGVIEAGGGRHRMLGLAPFAARVDRAPSPLARPVVARAELETPLGRRGAAFRGYLAPSLVETQRDLAATALFRGGDRAHGVAIGNVFGSPIRLIDRQQALRTAPSTPLVTPPPASPEVKNR